MHHHRQSLRSVSVNNMTPTIIKQLAEFFGKKFDALSAQIQTLAEKEVPEPLPFPEMKFPDVQKIQFDGIKVVTLKGDSGETPTDERLTALIEPLIPMPIKGDEGVSPTDAQLRKLIKPLIPKPIPGKSGKDSVVPGPPGKNGKNGIGKPGKDGSPDTPTQIIEKINQEKGTLIKRDKVEGLADIESMARTAQANSGVFRNSGSFVYDYELDSLLNGVTKTFTLPANAKIIMVIGTSGPIRFSKNTDYTYTASTITFTSQIDASTVLAAGQGVTILYKIL